MSVRNKILTTVYKWLMNPVSQSKFAVVWLSLGYPASLGLTLVIHEAGYQLAALTPGLPTQL